MHITHVVQDLAPESGGPPVVALELSKVDEQDRYSASLVSMTEYEVAFKRAESMGMTDATIIHSLSSKNIFSCFKKFTQIIRSTDFVHFHGMWTSTTLMGGIICLLNRKPYTVHIHGMLDPWSMQQSSKKKKLAFNLIFKKILNSANLIICSTEVEKINISNLGLNPNLVVIPNGVNVDGILLDDGKYFREQFTDIKGPYIYFLSRLHHKKGAMLLLEAYAELSLAENQLSLVIAGSDEGEEGKLNEFISKNGLFDNVHLPGPMWGELKSSALSGCFCFCLPSYQEGFSMVVLEAMAHNCCIALTRQCNFPDIEIENAGVITEPDKDELVSALKYLVSIEKDIAGMGRNARKLVEKRYVWARIKNDLVDIYVEHM